MLSDPRRRDLLVLGAASLACAATRVAHAPPPTSLLDAYLDARGFREGTAFWLARGTRYALVGTRFIPFQRSMVIEAVRFGRTDGVMASFALEGSFSFDLAGAPSYTIDNPLTHAPVTIRPGSIIAVDYQYAADGALDLAPSSRANGTVRGGLAWEEAGRAANVTEAFEGYAPASPTGEPVLSELIAYRPDPASWTSRGFLRASKSVTVVRAWPYPAPDGVTARLFTLYEGTKFGDPDALLASAGEAIVRSTYPDLIDRLRAF